MRLKKILIFGAGKIGRSFIAQLFSSAGYECVFVDIFMPVIEALNSQRKYNVITASDEGEETIEVRNVRGICAGDREKVIAEFSEADLFATSVGKKGLEGVLPLMAEGIRSRYSQYPDRPADIIIAENMRNADEYFREHLEGHLPSGFPLESYVGLVETSIGKMVPLRKEDDMQADLLNVYAEPYNTLILDKRGFRYRIPEVMGLALKENMKAWVDRKVFIHNLGHSAVAYAGYYHHPDLKYLYQVLEQDGLRAFVRDTMIQSAEILLRIYPEEFTRDQLHEHIEDLIHRFRNRALGDTVFRVGSDLERKLGREDRLVIPLRAGLKLGCEVDKIAEVMCYAFFFRAAGEDNNRHPGDERIISLLEEKGISHVLTNTIELNAAEKDFIINRLTELSVPIKYY